MVISFSKISNIFLDFLDDVNKEFNYENELQKLVYLNIKANKTLWDLEDSARLAELGDKHIVETKKNIDITNQSRSNLIREIDMVLYKALDIIHESSDRFYSESPGMIIDRLSIIFIKLTFVRKLVSVIEEADLQLEYLEKEKILMGQIEMVGSFLDLFIEGLLKKEVFFEIQQPVKIYNDKRVKKYIGIINRKK
ncbi:MAG: hypothetical protein COZ49_04475 [Candidatus Yonathbacteria bacterium CG_4_10_14_3_um_filter_47_65]|uniref:Uncharacterized protein n=2 Tax=Parcubacteria group TaxID=1794811 RepID=A0A2M8D786_9BACT|nr:MAG: hypothetical protein AUJ44_02115 [Candidatus Nomurabacteria bacterium CG1_02_47_685]PIP04076.1 MAG: hypothetical protein COX54_01110 [Candidatus Yonathbacteria bacterium CG23_combo_of_CG06-09_8_20_14_all_46_18]PIQ32444.1 MAG: hypothetical protein COW61_01720 [Candidatus Yonathbacteria bacterium CG17_big_fil_post_rev_8_21_14_2_50_46_19]PIX56005.1 MAG: hypothetical protein COZ49_04475 [Candidatus Yonathbacteria bacterium CG_4_10_14_3_um_filter_47_65]PIY57336.1 MAG: hypothetical protein CO